MRISKKNSKYFNAFIAFVLVLSAGCSIRYKVYTLPHGMMLRDLDFPGKICIDDSNLLFLCVDGTYFTGSCINQNGDTSGISIDRSPFNIKKPPYMTFQRLEKINDSITLLFKNIESSFILDLTFFKGPILKDTQIVCSKEMLLKNQPYTIAYVYTLGTYCGLSIPTYKSTKIDFAFDLDSLLNATHISLDFWNCEFYNTYNDVDLFKDSFHLICESDTVKLRYLNSKGSLKYVESKYLNTKWKIRRYYRKSSKYRLLTTKRE